MTFKEMLDLTGIKHSEGEFRAEAKPPYIVWESDCETVCADSVVVDIVGSYSVYLAVSRGDETSEKALEAVLDEHGVAYTKDKSWIGGKQMIYLCEYDFAAQVEW